MKYLVRWKLLLGSEELRRLSSQPRFLEPGFDYVKKLMSRGKVVGLYRIIWGEPTIVRGRPTIVREMPRLVRGVPRSVRDMPPGVGVARVPEQPSGIAIVEAESLEEVRKLVEGVPGMISGGVSGVTYLEYEIVPLEEIGLE